MILVKKKKWNAIHFFFRLVLHIQKEENIDMPLVAAFTPESAALGGLTLGAGKKHGRRSGESAGRLRRSVREKRSCLFLSYDAIDHSISLDTSG